MEKLGGIFEALEVSASGMSAQRRRMNAIAENLANVSTTRTRQGGPYRRRITRFSAGSLGAEFRRNLAEQQAVVQLRRTRGEHIQGEALTQHPQRFAGVQAQVLRDDSPPLLVYDPGHPDADENGYVKMPNINVVAEMVDMISASRAYEANVTAVKAVKEMARKALEI